MSDLPIVEGVLNYVKENNISFCMPGHKGGKGFRSTEEGNQIANNMLEFDLTEVDGLDNMHHSEGIIREASIKLSELYGSKKSYFLVNGSTSGNLIMIYSCFDEGDKIIVERNCHKSIVNSIIMRKLKPLYIKNLINNEYNAPLSLDVEHFLDLIKNNTDAKGIVITYPNYYGVCSNLKKIIAEAKKYDMKVLVDSAHGAHFGFHDDLPKTALQLGADMVVMSCHKTLPSLTQTAYLHVSDNINMELVDFYWSSFSSTSPSYLFLCSMDYSRYFMEKYAKIEYEKLLKLCNNYRKKINSIEGFYIIEEEDINKNNEKYLCKLDKSRYIINLKKGYSGHKLLEYLRGNKIQGEMSDGSNVILIFSPFNKEEDFERLYTVLKSCNIKTLMDKLPIVIEHGIPEKIVEPYEILMKKKIKVNIEDAENKICGESIIPYPPGVPLVLMGEKIEKHAIEKIKYYTYNNVSIIGIKENRVTIIEG